MIDAGKKVVAPANLEEQLITIVKVLHMMPILRAKIFKLVQDEIARYLAKPNDYMRSQNGELILKDPNVDFSKIYTDKSTRGRGW